LSKIGAKLLIFIVKIGNVEALPMQARLWLCIQLSRCWNNGRRKRGGSGGPWPPWIIIHDTHKVEGGLMLLFFGLAFSVAPPGKFSADALGRNLIPKLLSVSHDYIWPTSKTKW